MDRLDWMYLRALVPPGGLGAFIRPSVGPEEHRGLTPAGRSDGLPPVGFP